MKYPGEIGVIDFGRLPLGNTEPASGNVLQADGQVWRSRSPEEAGLLKTDGAQTIRGVKTFEADAPVRGRKLFSYQKMVIQKNLALKHEKPAGVESNFCKQNICRT